MIINRNLIHSETVQIKIKQINKKSKIVFEKTKKDNTLIKSVFTAKLKAGEITVLTVN